MLMVRDDLCNNIWIQEVREKAMWLSLGKSIPGSGNGKCKVLRLILMVERHWVEVHWLCPYAGVREIKKRRKKGMVGKYSPGEAGECGLELRWWDFFFFFKAAACIVYFLKFYLLYLLFIFDCSGSSCGRWTSRCGGSSCCLTRALGARAPVAVARGLPMASGIFLDQGSNLCPLHWQVDSWPLNHQESPSYS